MKRSKYNFKKMTGLQKTIHAEYLNKNLSIKQQAIKRGIQNALFIIDCERAGNLNSEDAESRIVMCCIDEQLEKLEGE